MTPQTIGWFIFIIVVVIVLFLMSDTLPAIRGLLALIAGAGILLMVAIYMATEKPKPKPVAVVNQRVIVDDPTPQPIRLPPPPKPVIEPIRRPVTQPEPERIVLHPPVKVPPAPEQEAKPVDPYINPVDEPLTDEERKAYNIALGQASRAKPPNSEQTKRALHLQSLSSTDQYSHAQDANISGMKKNENNLNLANRRDNAKCWNEADFYQRSLERRDPYGPHAATIYRQNVAISKNVIEANRKAREANNQAIAAQAKAQAQIDNCYRARALQDVHEKFGQYKKALAARRLAETACK